MNRDKQIDLVTSASARANDRVVAWISDPKVKAALRNFHKHSKMLKDEQKRARA